MVNLELNVRNAIGTQWRTMHHFRRKAAEELPGSSSEKLNRACAESSKAKLLLLLEIRRGEYA